MFDRQRGQIALWLVLGMLLLAGVGWWARGALAPLGVVGSANKAKLLCSAVLGAGRDAAELLGAEVGTDQLQLVDVELDAERGEVVGSVLWFSEAVLYRPGLGCTRAVGTSVEALRAQVPAAVVPEAPDLTAVPWPTGDVIDPALMPAHDAAALAEVVATAFAEPDPSRPVNTRALLVVWRGQLVAERYGPEFDADTPLIGWSMTKSLTNALVGMRVLDGALDLAAPAAVPEWQQPGDPRAAITLDQLLRMSSGLAFTEDYGGLESDVVTMLFGAGGHDMGGFAATRPLAGPPDSRWYYSSGTTNLVQRILRGSFERHEDYLAFPAERLFHRIGMTRSWIEPDASGTFVGSSFGYGTGRDWARFGLLFLQDGVWEGERLLPEGWVAYSTTPTPLAPQGRYGAHWWLNAGDADDPTRRPWPRLPRDAYRASGFEGQSVMIVPSAELVVVRLGYSPDERVFDIGAFTADVIDVLSRGALAQR
ncbi:MAG: serine hydrolase [Pseudomonadales bacterium]|nr:serine hydrolase [Pseudomonadales bacterium]